MLSKRVKKTYASRWPTNWAMSANIRD